MSEFLTPSVLVIDDEPDNFDVIEALLCNESYQLNYAPGGQEALQLLEAFQPDVILLDLMMPNMSGIEFCQCFKADAKWRHIPIIMVTSLNSKEDLGRCLEAGADDFISKPVNRIELRSRLQSMLRIKHQYDDLQSLLKLREDMVGMVVHDLRNPIASILLAAEMLRYPKLAPEKKQKKVEQIVTSGQDLRTLVDNLLLMSKLEAGKLNLMYTEIDITSLGQLALEGLEDVASQKQLKLVAQLPPLGSNCIKADPSLLRRVIDNLLSNAIKFAPVKSQITLSADYLSAGGVKIQVADLGAGVSQELRQTIFEKYEIGTLMKGVNQTGLGLAFCKIAIEAHGGRIMVDDNHPRGSVFTVELSKS